ncbi:MAG: NADH-quinone oxidoreductase subunit J [Candidatus Krumholzibacteriia bacterium]
MEAFLFYFCGALMVLSGLAMVITRDTVVGVCWLIFAFLNAAGIFAALSAPFLAVLQVLVYAGAIMVLFLFVVMMLQGPVLEHERRPLKPWIWPFVGLPVLAIALATAAFVRRVPAVDLSGPVPEGFGEPAWVAHLLLSRYLLAFELISILLLVGMIGALALGKVERKLPWR